MRRIVVIMTRTQALYLDARGGLDPKQKNAARFDTFAEARAAIIKMDSRARRKRYRRKHYAIKKLAGRTEIVLDFKKRLRVLIAAQRSASRDTGYQTAIARVLDVLSRAA